MGTNEANGAAIARILNGLNFNQKKAVTAPPSGRLQIIAGPGTGKTKVLVSRVAYLMIKHGIEPYKIIVTTFTKKAANEMIERLHTLLHDQQINLDKLLIGTFHSICFRILKIYGSKIGLQDYSIADERDSNQLLKEILENLNSNDLVISSNQQEQAVFKGNKHEKSGGFDYKRLKTHISKLKSKNIVPEQYYNGVCNRFLATVYTKYQQKLADEKVLDFDDCLLYCNKLISAHPVLNFVEHVLVDEFQDTNEVQLQLMYQFARGHPTDPNLQDNITIVGDPDQSIYAFRNAQSKNFMKMKDHYSRKLGFGCDEIQLTDNYRSTNDILRFSEAIMRQQSTRTEKNLVSLYETSYKPTYKLLNSAEQEARWIVYQIEHLLALPRSPIKFSDVSIIVRSANQTRVIENELTRRHIPYSMIRGKAFWDRQEVVSILDYLRVVASSTDRIAYMRTLKYPKRGFGDKTMEYLNTLFEDNAVKQISAFDTLKMLAQGQSSSKFSSKCLSNLRPYLDFIERARSMMREAETAPEPSKEVLLNLFDYIYTNSGLKKEFNNQKEQQLNITEVQSQLCDFSPKDEELASYIGASSEDVLKDDRNLLTKFIQSVGLYETQAQVNAGDSGDKFKGKVSISTIHGSKGLEWPVVFVPGLTEGLLPSAFAQGDQDEESIDEERRCLYVATTRPKILLYLTSYTETEGRWGRLPLTDTSRFLKNLVCKRYVSEHQEAFKSTDQLLRLYGLFNNEDSKPDYKVFNLLYFRRLYEERMWAFVKGENFAIIGEDYSGSQIDVAKLTKSTPLGFTSAKQELGRQRKFPSVGLAKPKVKIEQEVTNQDIAYSSMLTEIGFSGCDITTAMESTDLVSTPNNESETRTIKRRKLGSALELFGPSNNQSQAMAKMLEMRKYLSSKMIPVRSPITVECSKTQTEIKKPKTQNPYASVISMLTRKSTAKLDPSDLNNNRVPTNAHNSRGPLHNINKEALSVPVKKAPKYAPGDYISMPYVPIKRAPAYIPNRK
jgi:DNA helicase-2/ATP-dependent DNA helicase PcrA